MQPDGYGEGSPPPTAPPRARPRPLLAVPAPPASPGRSGYRPAAPHAGGARSFRRSSTGAARASCRCGMLRSTSTVTLLSGGGSRTPGTPSRRVSSWGPNRRGPASAFQPPGRRARGRGRAGAGPWPRRPTVAQPSDSAPDPALTLHLDASRAEVFRGLSGIPRDFLSFLTPLPSQVYWVHFEKQGERSCSTLL